MFGRQETRAFTGHKHIMSFLFLWCRRTRDFFLRLYILPVLTVLNEKIFEFFVSESKTSTYPLLSECRPPLPCFSTFLRLTLAPLSVFISEVCHYNSSTTLHNSSEVKWGGTTNCKCIASCKDLQKLQAEAPKQSLHLLTSFKESAAFLLCTPSILLLRTIILNCSKSVMLRLKRWL